MIIEDWKQGQILERVQGSNILPHPSSLLLPTPAVKNKEKKLLTAQRSKIWGAYLDFNPKG